MAEDSRPLYNSRTVETFFQLLRKRYPRVDGKEVLSYAGMEAYQVADPAHWFTQEQIDRMHERLVALTGNPAIAREAGRYSASAESLGIHRQYILTLLSPAQAFAVIGKASAHFTRTSDFACRKLGPRSVEITVSFRAGVEEQPYQCENRTGILEAVPMIYNHRVESIEHPECIFHGGQVCRYLIRWEENAAARVRLWRNLAAGLLTLLTAAGAIAAPQALPVLFPSALATVFGLGLWASRLELQALQTTVGNLHDPNAKLLEQIDQNYNHALLANEIGQAISADSSVAEILASVIAILERRMDFDRGMILLADPAATRLDYAAGYGLSAEQQAALRATPLPLTGEAPGLCARSFLQNRPLLVNEPEEESNLPAESREWLRALGSRAFLCCPIVADEQAIGVLAVDRVGGERPLLQSDLSRLLGIAPVIGISLANAELLAAQQRHKHAIQTLEQARDAIAAEKGKSDQLAEDLQLTNEELKNFAYIISHDLRAPLVNIRGFAQELTSALREATPLLTPLIEQLGAGERRELELLLQQDVPEAVGFINASVQRMDGQINAILKLSRLGRREFKAERIDLGQLVGELLKTLTHQLESRQASATLGALPTLSSDRLALEQIFGNLLDNATKYLDPSRPGRLRIEAEAQGSDYLIHVHDNGRGIAAEEMEKVFAPFRRAGKLDTPGEGMGLAYVRTLVRALGGRIQCSSTFGVGTTFSLSLPARLPTSP
jgi:signal transduction histidine kinase